MQPEQLPDAQSCATLKHFRQLSPLVHCMTNDVVQGFTANVLLALGASPAMVIHEHEAAQFSAIADALLINLGTLNEKQRSAMLAAVEAANANGTPWVLDPVAIGTLTFRTDFSRELIQLRPAAIRANASEILALAGGSGGGRGVDSTDDLQHAWPAAQKLAGQSGAIVALTGEQDYVTDGKNSWCITGGGALMTRVVGTGCALSAVVAACCSLPGKRLDNVACACDFFARAGDLAIAQSRGPGSFIPVFLDALYQLNVEKAP